MNEMQCGFQHPNKEYKYCAGQAYEMLREKTDLLI